MATQTALGIWLKFLSRLPFRGPGHGATRAGKSKHLFPKTTVGRLSGIEKGEPGIESTDSNLHADTITKLVLLTSSIKVLYFRSPMISSSATTRSTNFGAATPHKLPKARLLVPFLGSHRALWIRIAKAAAGGPTYRECPQTIN